MHLITKVVIEDGVETIGNNAFRGAVSLTEVEIELLPYASIMLTLECGIRFLTDHINGDTYFRIHRENHNLDRCRTQFKLVAEMEKNLDKMKEIINSLL